MPVKEIETCLFLASFATRCWNICKIMNNLSEIKIWQGLLQPLPMPDRPWGCIALDFIYLPRSQTLKWWDIDYHMFIVEYFETLYACFNSWNRLRMLTVFLGFGIYIELVLFYWLSIKKSTFLGANEVSTSLFCSNLTSYMKICVLSPSMKLHSLILSASFGDTTP